jgi:hypothetical protein
MCSSSPSSPRRSQQRSGRCISVLDGVHGNGSERRRERGGSSSIRPYAVRRSPWAVDGDEATTPGPGRRFIISPEVEDERWNKQQRSISPSSPAMHDQQSTTLARSHAQILNHRVGSGVRCLCVRIRTTCCTYTNARSPPLRAYTDGPSYCFIVVVKNTKVSCSFRAQILLLLCACARLQYW